MSQDSTSAQAYLTGYGVRMDKSRVKWIKTVQKMQKLLPPNQ